MVAAGFVLLAAPGSLVVAAKVVLPAAPGCLVVVAGTGQCAALEALPVWLGQSAALEALPVGLGQYVAPEAEHEILLLAGTGTAAAAGTAPAAEDHVS